MDYIFFQHYNLETMLSERQPKIILLAEPEPESQALYRRHLDAPDFVVNVCNDLAEIHNLLSSTLPDLLILNPGANPVRSLTILKGIKKNYPAMRIITLGYGTPEEYLDRFMQLGVSYHINRNLTRPQDVAMAARQVLQDF